VSDQLAHTVVRCTRVGDDGSCGREQAVALNDAGIGVRVATTVSDEIEAWLSSFGWRRVDGSFGWRRVDGGRWLFPFCARWEGSS
jgi:hypothetical protein